MKYTILAIGIMFGVNVHADIEYSAADAAKATAQEISRNRTCFQTLTVQGCVDPSEDHEQFKSCLLNVYPTLTTYCKKMMSDLYGVK